MEKKLTHWKEAFNPDYIGAYAFQPDEEKVVTIKGTRMAVVFGENGRKENKTIVDFVEDVKPLILNRTNGKTIEKLAKSPFEQHWTGLRVTLYVDHNVKGKAGEIVDGVRVRPKLPEQAAAKSVKCADCGKAIAGTDTMPAAVVAERTKAKYGKALCVACGAKRKAQTEGAGDGEKA